MNTVEGMAARERLDIQSAEISDSFACNTRQAYGGMLMGFVTIHKGDPIGAAPQPMGVVGRFRCRGSKDTHAIAQASRSNIGIFIRQKRD